MIKEGSKEVKFGNVSFTETGISYEVPYKDPDWDKIPHSKLKVLECVKQLVAGRLQSCIEHLNKNVANNIGSSKDFIYFKDGSHFSRRAAEAMQRILKCTNLGAFDGMMFIQAIKSCINPVMVLDANIIASNLTEKELTCIMDVLMEYQVAYQNARETACRHNLLAEFEKSMNQGFTVNEALKEWDIYYEL